MIQLITGKKGSGKTKVLVDMINVYTDKTKGNVVCIEKGMKLTYDVSHRVRLVAAEEYNIESFEMFYGFVAGCLASNFDISAIFVDGILKMGGRNYEQLADMVAKLDKISGESINIVFTVSADPDELPESLKGFIK